MFGMTQSVSMDDIVKVLGWLAATLATIWGVIKSIAGIRAAIMGWLTERFVPRKRFEALEAEVVALKSQSLCVTTDARHRKELAILAEFIEATVRKQQDNAKIITD